MNIRSIITVILVLVIVALGASAIFIFNKNKASQQLASTNNLINSGDPQNQGKLMVGITDAGADIAGVTSIVLTIDKMEIHHQNAGWVMVADKPSSTYDLLELKKSGSTALLAQTNVTAGIYDQTRLIVSKIIVTKNGVATEAKLPSNSITITGILMIETGKTSTMVFDIIADDSLHTTTNGTFIFAPVIKFETKSGTDAVVDSANQITMTAGHTDTILNTGMTVDGEMKNDFMLNSQIILTELGNVIKVGNTDLKDKAIKINAETAISTAISNKSLDSVTSVAFVVENGKKVWVVSGWKNMVITSVYLDPMTGFVVNY